MESLSARRAWIEIVTRYRPIPKPVIVALRKESVDRNNRPDGQKYINRVALRKESVDRNCIMGWSDVFGWSLSARRAWIEIVMQEIAQQRKQRSLSARRAWIEIAQGWRISGCTLRRSPQGERG